MIKRNLERDFRFWNVALFKIFAKSSEERECLSIFSGHSRREVVDIMEVERK